MAQPISIEQQVQEEVGQFLTVIKGQIHATQGRTAGMLSDSLTMAFSNIAAELISRGIRISQLEQQVAHLKAKLPKPEPEPPKSTPS